jgi:hypothetical protein
MLDDAGHGPVGELFDWFFVSALRNSFAHADYTLHKDKFRSRSEVFAVGGVMSPEVGLDLLVDIFNRALGFFGIFIEEYETQRKSYKANKIVLGRFSGDEPEPIELLSTEGRGLYGFRAPPDNEHSRD